MLRVVVLLVLLCVPGVRAAEVLDEQAFTKRYAAMLVSSYEGANVEIVGPLEVRVTGVGDENSTSFLDNAYGAYLSDPAELESILQRFVDSIGEMIADEDTTGDIDSLFPVIKDVGYIEQVRELMRKSEGAGQEAPFPLYFEPLNNDLVVMYAFDSEASIRFASGADIEALGIQGKALQVRALDNLLAYLPEIGREGDDSLSMIVADGNYEASLLLYDEIWSRDVFRVAGDIVVFVPARDVVLVTGSEDEAGLARARDLLSENDFSYAISPHAYVRTADGWARFEP
ncbi:MAG: DUF1444 domain-containing protein [Pseudomonadota bacterium]